MRTSLMNMQNRLKPVAVAVLALTASLGLAWAQTNVTSPTLNSDRAGRVIVPSPVQSVDSINLSTTAVRPVRPERNAMPPEVLARIEKFKADARRYLEQQEALRKKMLGATDQERARLREQVHALREQWLQRARELRMESKDRQAELLDKLPGHREVIENARQAARERVKDTVRDGRDRRGQD